jgi:hypothetical protein
MWIYYSAEILLFDAEVRHVLDTRRLPVSKGSVGGFMEIVVNHVQ